MKIVMSNRFAFKIYNASINFVRKVTLEPLLGYALGLFKVFVKIKKYAGYIILVLNN